MSTIRKSWVLALLLLGVFVGPARAQDLVTVDVPFAFMAGHNNLPAGPYRIDMAVGAVTRIQSTDDSSAVLSFTIPAGGEDPLGDQPCLVFARYGTVYRLAEVWSSGRYGHEFPGLLRGRKIPREQTQNGPSTPEVYVLAANVK